MADTKYITLILWFHKSLRNNHFLKIPSYSTFLGIFEIKAKLEGQVLGTTSQAISLQRKETVKDTRIITFFRSLFGEK